MRPTGEEIDGAFYLGGRTFLLEAKWHKDSIPASDLYAFKGKVDGKLVGTLGVFISMSGYECTFCKDCTTRILAGTCPNCLGNLVQRPVRPLGGPAGGLGKHPASTKRVLKAGGCLATPVPAAADDPISCTRQRTAASASKMSASARGRRAPQLTAVARRLGVRTTC